MKLLMWEFQSLTVPMMEGSDGNLYCTTRIISESLGITEDAIYSLYRFHKDEFSFLSLKNFHAKEFVAANKDLLKIERVKENIRIWTEDDMILFAVLSGSPTAKEFRKNLLQLIKKNAVKSHIHVDDHNKVAKELSDRVAALEKALVDFGILQKQNASAAGRMLNSHKEIKNSHLSLVRDII